MVRPAPDFDHERALFAQGALRVAGMDEVGRGPLAGPVTVCALRLDPARIPPGLADSKALTATRREMLAAALLDCAQVSIAHATVEEIDRLNILGATELAMCRAVAGLDGIDHILIDGNRVPKALTLPATAIVKGDARCLSIAAASIVAKVTRDRIMVDLAQQHPGYGWEHNAGYPTRAHLEALQNLGITAHHRRSFGPVHKILYQAVSVSG